LHDSHAVAHLDSLVDVMRYEQYGRAELVVNAQKLVLQPLPHDRVHRAKWLIPASFLIAMCAGGALAATGAHFPIAEQGILTSVLILGLLITFAARLPACHDDSTWARPYLEWAECAALIRPGDEGEDADGVVVGGFPEVWVETTEEAAGLAQSIRGWRPFADTVPALQRLKTRYKLAVLSNIDDDLFAFTAPKLGVELDLVVTAQQVQSYKPSLRNFEILLQHLPVDKHRLLHAAESLYHDVVPAHTLGITTAWVNRRQGKTSAATKLVDAQPDIEVPTVGALADLLLRGSNGERTN
jgi:2-haloalkanoic acid dehalogenase type II